MILCQMLQYYSLKTRICSSGQDKHEKMDDVVTTERGKERIIFNLDYLLVEPLGVKCEIIKEHRLEEHERCIKLNLDT